MMNQTSKKFVYDVWLYLILILFFVPFLGDLGKTVFMPLGKFYYSIIFIFCFVNFVCRYFFNEKLINGIFYAPKSKKSLYYLVFFAVILSFILCVLVNRAIDNFLYFVILVGFFVFFITYKYTSKNLVVISLLGGILLLLVFVFFSFKKFEYFNPNSYAEIATVLFLLTNVNHKRTAESRILFFINLIVAVYTAEFIYGSETQLLAIVFFVFLVAMRRFILKTPKRCKVVVLFVWAFVVALPFISYILISKNVLDLDIFTNRGERWFDSIKSIREFGIFSSGMTVPGSHNGFLDLCVKYTFFGAIIYVVIMIAVIWRNSRYIVKNDSVTVILCAVLSIVLMNSVESLFVGLTDSYFLLIFMGMLVSLSLNEKHKEGEMQIYCDEITCEKCYI